MSAVSPSVGRVEPTIGPSLDGRDLARSATVAATGFAAATGPIEVGLVISGVCAARELARRLQSPPSTTRSTKTIDEALLQLIAS